MFGISPIAPVGLQNGLMNASGANRQPLMDPQAGFSHIQELMKVDSDLEWLKRELESENEIDLAINQTPSAYSLPPPPAALPPVGLENPGAQPPITMSALGGFLSGLLGGGAPSAMGTAGGGGGGNIGGGGGGGSTGGGFSALA